MIDPALITLLRLHARAVFRRMGGALRSTRGIIYLLIGVAVLLIYVGPRLFIGIRAADPDSQLLLDMFPLVLLSVCAMTLLTNGGGKAFYFTPAEVDFLFPGPFPRRQVLLYKITKSVGAALLGSLFFSCFLLSWVHHWLAGYVAIFLSMVFLQMFSMSLVLATQTVSARVVSRGRWIIVTLLIVAAGLVLFRWTPADHGAINRAAVVQWIKQSQAAQIVLWPFAAFAKVAVSRRLLTELPARAGAAAAIDAVLIATVLWLDSDYLESSAAQSERLHARRMRARRGQGFLSSTVATGIRLPSLGFVGGIGPLAWRQLTGAARTARTTLIFLLTVCLIAPLFLQRIIQTDPLIPTLSIAGWLVLFTTNLLRFDFRGDLEQIDVLKALPLRPSSVVAGEVAAPVAILSLMHFCLLIGLSAVAPQHRAVALAAAVLIVPTNLLFSLLENYIFLLFPIRDMTVSPGDLQGTGRRMVVLVIKMGGVLIAGLIAAVAGAAAYALLGRIAIVGCAVASLVLALIGAAMVPLLASAFVRFDPSVDTPA